MNRYTERLYNGIVKQNPTFVLMLGMCPTLAVTTSAINGALMGVSTAFVLVMSNTLISALRKIIPEEIRIPAYIVVISAAVSVIEMLIRALSPSVYTTLGLYIPLIVVNCIILGRAEAYASSHGIVLSMLDGLGMGTGFTIGLTFIGMFRELLGSGTLFGRDINEYVFKGKYTPAAVFVMAPGAFFVLAFLIAAIKKKGGGGACAGNCSKCSKKPCAQATDIREDRV